jgi:hypothetical protein
MTKRSNYGKRRRGREQGVLTGHGDWVRSVSVAGPSNSLAASAGDDGRVLIWNYREKTRIGKLEGHVGPVANALFCPERSERALLGRVGRIGSTMGCTESDECEQRTNGMMGDYCHSPVAPDGMTCCNRRRDGHSRTVWDLDYLDG